MSTPVTRRPERTQRTQQRLFEAAMVVMSQKGPGASTVDEVAAQAGVSKGTVYYNFGSKRSMVDGVLRYGIEQAMTHVREAFAASDDPLTGIEGGVRAGLTFLAANPGFARLAVAEVWRPGAAVSDVLVAQRADVLREITEMVEALSPRYAVRDVEPGSVAVALFGALLMLSMDGETIRTPGGHPDAVPAVMGVVHGYLADVERLTPRPSGRPGSTG